MTPVLIVLLGLSSVTGACLAGMLIKTQQMLVDQSTATHIECLANVEQLINGHHAADTLEAVAKEWESPSGQHLLKLQGRLCVQDGPSAGALWMREIARQLREAAESRG